MSDRIREAFLFCVAAHEAVGQRRKYTGEPYWKHPVAASRKVQSVCSSENAVIGALLHDVVEDTAVGLETIAEFFGPNVMSLVEQVTDVSKPEDGNRATRKEIDRLHIAKATATAKTIKLADLIDNTQSIVEHDPEFAKVYMAEKKKLLEVLGDGDPSLYDEAMSIVDSYFNESKE